MKNLMLELPHPRKDIPDEVTISKDSESAVGSKNDNSEWSGTGDSSYLNVEKDLYALLDLCVHLQELETKKKEISGMRREPEAWTSKMAATLKKKESFLRKIISVTRKRLRCTDT